MGILLAMPFGPINLLGIQRAVERGFFGGMAAGIGIMAGDGLIALGAALGVNAISGAIRQYRTAIQIVGGITLLGFGITLYLTRAAVATEAHPPKAPLGTISGTSRRCSSSPSPTPRRCWGSSPSSAA
jgi:threonine/homoserine/homoserine lactone efflux protein